MKLLRFLIVALALLPGAALAQSNPGLVYGQVPTAAERNSYFGSKQDLLGYTPLNKAGDTMLGELNTFATTASSSGLNLAPGIAPTSPLNGDILITSGGFYARVNGTTLGPLGTAACSG